MAAREVVLDVRDLEPPEPYELATETLSNLQPGQYVRMISRRMPRLLYPWLDEHGFCEETRDNAVDLYEIFIWIAGDTDTAEFIKTSG